MEMAHKTYRIMAESTGTFMVDAENEAQAEEMVLDHMHRVGTPYLSTPGSAIRVLPEGNDKVLSIRVDTVKPLSTDIEIEDTDACCSSSAQEAADARQEFEHDTQIAPVKLAGQKGS
jgi:hypothetical protein